MTRSEIIAEGKKLFKAMGVQPGDIQYHVKQDNGGSWGDECRVMLPDGSHQCLLSDQDEEVTRFFVWAVKHFNTLTEE